MTWAKRDEVKVGTRLVADAGFTCLIQGEVVEVKRAGCCGALYVPCATGRHFLDGQLDDDWSKGYIGLSLAPNGASA